MDDKSKKVACLLVSVLCEVTHRQQGEASSDGLQLNTVWVRVLQTLSSTSAKTSLAFIMARLIITGLLGLEEIATQLSGSRHHPLFLIILQQMAQMIESKARPGQLPEGVMIDDGNYIPLASVDGARCLLTSVFECVEKEKRRDLVVRYFRDCEIVMTSMLPGKIVNF